MFIGIIFSKTGEYVAPFSIRWIILSILESKPSTELDSYKIILRICVMASCIFWIMKHICDRNWLIQWIRIKLANLLVTSSHWLDQILIVQDKFHIQWHNDRRTQSFLLRSHIFPNKRSHGIFEILFIHIQDRPGWILSYCIVVIYHLLLVCFLGLAFYLQ